MTPSPCSVSGVLYGPCPGLCAACHRAWALVQLLLVHAIGTGLTTVQAGIAVQIRSGEDEQSVV